MNLKSLLKQMPFSVVIFGAGNIASGYDKPGSGATLTHAHAIRENDQFVLTGFYDIDFQKAEEAARKWGVRALNNPEKADIIVICTPDNFHLESVYQAVALTPQLIILEKPIAKNINDAKEILQIAETVPIQVNFTRRFSRDFQDLLVHINEFGSFIAGSGLYGKGFIHNGSHMLDILCFLLGEIDNVIILNNFSDFYPDDPVKTARIILRNGGEFYMQGIDCSKYSIFELDLFFEKARIRILDGGYIIQIYMAKESCHYSSEINLKFDSEIRTDMDYAMDNLYKNVYSFLSDRSELLAPVQKVFSGWLYE
jgi:predicted dehydrogenase